MAKNSRFRNQVSKISKVKKRSNLYRTKKVLSKLFKKIKSFGKTKYNKCETVVTNYVENSKTMQNLMDTFEEISNEPAENKIIDNDLRELKSLGLTCKLNRGKFCHNLEANQNKSLIKQLCKINVSLAMSEAVSKGYPGFLWFKTDDIDNILPYLTQILNYQGGICKYFKIRYTRVNIDKYNIYLELPSYVISKYNLKCVNNVWHYKNSSYFRDLTENITKVNESTQYDNIYEYANNRSLNSNKLDKIYKDEVLNEDYDSKIYDSKIYESREYESQQCELKEYKLNDYENLRNLTSKDNENNYGNDYNYGNENNYGNDYECEDYLNVPKCDPKYSKIFYGDSINKCDLKYFDEYEERLNKHSHITNATNDAIKKLDSYCIHHIQKYNDKIHQLYNENDNYSIDESDIIELDEKIDSESESIDTDNVSDENEINIELDEETEETQTSEVSEVTKEREENIDDDIVVVDQHDYDSDDYEKI